MAGERTLKVTILGDADKLKGALASAGKDADTFGSKLGAASKVGAAAVGGLAVAGGVALFKLGGDFDSAFDGIRTATGKTGEDLKGLEQSFRNTVKGVPSSFDDVSKAIGGLASQTGLSGKPLESMSTQVLNLSRLTGTDLTGNISKAAKVMQDWKLPAADAGKALDAIFAASQKSGVSFDTLSGQMDKFGPTLRGLGLDATQSAALLAQMGQSGADADKIMAGLTRAVTTSGLSFGELKAKIAEGKTEADQMKIATDLLGKKVGLEFVDALKAGKLNAGDMTEALKGSSGAINQTASDTDDGAEKMKVAFNRAKVALEPLASGAFEFAATMAEKVAPVIETVAKWIQEKLVPAIQDAAKWVNEHIIPALQDLAVWFNDHVLPAVQAVWDKILGFGNWLRDVFSGDWSDVWQGVKDTFEGIWNGFVTFVTQWIPQKFLPALADVGAKALAWIGDQAPKLLAKLGDWTLQFLAWAADMGAKLLAKLGEWIVTTVLPWVVDQAPKILLKLGEWTLQFLAWVNEMNLKLLAGLADVAKDLLGWLADTAKDLPGELAKWTAHFVSWAGGLASSMVSGMAGLMGWIGGQAANLPSQLLHWTTQFVSWVGGLGAAAAQAIADFAADLGRAVLNALKEAANPLNWLPSIGGDKTGGTGIVPGYGGAAVPNGSAPKATGAAPTNSQGGTGQTIAQMWASGMSPAEIAEKTGLDVATVVGQIVSQVPGSVLGGDTDDDNDGDLTPSGPGEMNLASNAVKLRREITGTFKGYSSIGGYAYRTTAAGTPSDHATGHALDVMLPGLHNKLGDSIAAWAIRQPETKYAIWDNMIWSKQHPSWRDYATSGKVGKANQGSATGRHEDHVHISVLGQGGIVKARQGGTLALIGEAGQDEAVIPLPRGGDGASVGGITIHVHGSLIGGTPREVALALRDELVRAKREGVSMGLA